MNEIARRLVQVSPDDVIGPTRRGKVRREKDSLADLFDEVARGAPLLYPAHIDVNPDGSPHLSFAEWAQAKEQR